MKRVIESCFGLFFSLFIVFFVCLRYVDAVPALISVDVDIENDQGSIDSKSIDDLLGPDTNFPFDPANHRDGSNPIKRIGKISDDNL